MWCGVSYNERKSTNDRSLHASRTSVFLHGLLQSVWILPRLENVNNDKETIMLVRYSAVQLAMYPIMWAFYSFWH